MFGRIFLNGKLKLLPYSSNCSQWVWRWRTEQMMKDFVINHVRETLRDFLKPKELDAGLGINFQGSNCPACKYVWTHLKKPQNTVRCERRNGMGKQGHPRKPNKVALTDEAFKLFEKYLNETYIRKNWNWYQYMYITPGCLGSKKMRTRYYHSSGQFDFIYELIFRYSQRRQKSKKRFQTILWHKEEKSIFKCPQFLIYKIWDEVSTCV